MLQKIFEPCLEGFTVQFGSISGLRLLLMPSDIVAV